MKLNKQQRAAIVFDPVTPESITSDQIHTLRNVLASERSDPDHPDYDRSLGLFGPGADIQACWDANNGHLDRSMPEHRRECRAHCARLWNERAALTARSRR